MKPFLSIIVPVYKIKEEYLRECFDSLVAQDMSEFRIIVVDDGSPDKCGAICDEYADRDSRFTVIHQENSGVSVARNNGIKIADTEWIAFVDPDDWIEIDYISTLFKIQQDYNNVDIILFDYVQEFAHRQVKKQFMMQSGRLDHDSVENLRIAPFNIFMRDGKPYEYETNVIWNKMYRTSLIKNNGLWFEPKARKGQDVIFNAECFQLTGRYYYIKKALYHYRYLQGSITNSFNTKVQYYNEISFENYERIIYKYHLSEKYWDAYYARVVTRMYSSMRLYYFHANNHKERKEIDNEIGNTLEREPYKTALKRVKYRNLTYSQKVFVFFLKRRSFDVLRLLVKGRKIIKNLKGAKLRKD